MSRLLTILFVLFGTLMGQRYVRVEPRKADGVVEPIERVFYACEWWYFHRSWAARYPAGFEVMVLTQKACATEPCYGADVVVVVHPRVLFANLVEPCLKGPGTWVRTTCPDPCKWPDFDGDLDVDLRDLSELIAGPRLETARE